jgi:membrane protease YdiL (CAAX protease family)
VLELLVTIVFWLVLVGVTFAVLHRITGVKKLRDMPPAAAMIATLGMLAVLLPATLLAARVTGRRIGSLSSVQGHLRWRWLLTCLGVALAVRAIPVALGVIGVVAGDRFAGWSAFLPQLAIVITLVPLQAAAEEYFYRGTLLQCVGSFTGSPWVPAIISTVAFTVSHGFRPEIIIAITAVGASSAWMTLRTGGLEAAMGHHIVLNVSVMALSAATTGLEIGHNAHVHWLGVVMSVATVGIYTAVIARIAATNSVLRSESASPLEPTC